MLTWLIESGSDEEFRSETELKKLFGSLADELESYTAYVRQNGSTGSEHELSIFEHVIKSGATTVAGCRTNWFPLEDVSERGRSLRRDPGAAADSADEMLAWVRGDAGRILNQRMYSGGQWHRQQRRAGWA